jgi:hypothetical protein
MIKSPAIQNTNANSHPPQGESDEDWSLSLFIMPQPLSDLYDSGTLWILLTPPKRFADELALLRLAFDHRQTTTGTIWRGWGDHRNAQIRRRIPARDVSNQFL